MKILFNPESGAPIHDFIVKGKLLDEHPTGQLRRYEDQEADALTNTYEFLMEVQPEDAKSMMGKSVKVDVTNQLECTVCGKSFEIKLALAGHQRTHKGVDFNSLPVKTTELDLSDIPLASGKKVLNQQQTNAILKDYEMTGNLESGADTEGVDWYGSGLTEERGSLSKVTPIGQRGHFGA